MGFERPGVKRFAVRAVVFFCGIWGVGSVGGVMSAVGQAAEGDNRGASEPTTAAPGVAGPKGSKMSTKEPIARTTPYWKRVPGLFKNSPLALPRGRQPKLVWTGFFKASNGTPVVFLQTTKPVETEVSLGLDDPYNGPSAQLKLRGCGMVYANNARPLDVKFFGTDVLSVQAKKFRKSVEVTVSLENTVSPNTWSEPGPKGTMVYYVAFGDLPVEALAFRRSRPVGAVANALSSGPDQGQ